MRAWGQAFRIPTAGRGHAQASIGMSCQPIAGYVREMFSAACTMNIGSKKLLPEVASTFCGAQRVNLMPGTDVVVLQNLPQAGGSRQLDALAALITSAAAEWPSPVTVTWVDVRDAGQPPDQMPPVVFSTRLIKKSDVCTMDNPALQLREWAKGMQRFAPRGIP